jgi:hypothetical protein
MIFTFRHAVAWIHKLPIMLQTLGCAAAKVKYYTSVQQIEQPNPEISFSKTHNGDILAGLKINCNQSQSVAKCQNQLIIHFDNPCSLRREKILFHLFRVTNAW